ncbi:MAG: tetratricopeptide repeat protein, partial [Blastocatellia bacterium]|nr:tetratricopeptide repeat protein [Blastocatellia bacterium]
MEAMEVVFKQHKPFIVVLSIVLVMLFCLTIKPGMNVEQSGRSLKEIEQSSQNFLEKASLLNRNLHSNPNFKHSEAEYLEVISTYKKALDRDRVKQNGDEILLAMAKLSEEIAKEFHKPRYYYSAIDYYQQLFYSYPQSRHKTSALVSVAKIYEKDLADTEEAIRTYSEIAKQFPNSITAREAEAKMARLLPYDELLTEAPKEAINQREPYITSIRSFSSNDYARIVVDLTSNVEFERYESGNSIVIVLPKVKLTQELAARNLATNLEGMLTQVKAEES